MVVFLHCEKNSIEDHVIFNNRTGDVLFTAQTINHLKSKKKDEEEENVYGLGSMNVGIIMPA